jgi:formylglycine-generating enzyme required for sulfatase activity
LHFGGALGAVVGRLTRRLNNRYLNLEAAGLKRRSEGRVPGAVLAVLLALSIVACGNRAGQGDSSAAPSASKEKVEPKTTAATPATADSAFTPPFKASAWNLPDDDLVGFAEISAGKFTMGSDKTRDSQAQDDELPRHVVTLPAFFIARYEVTVGQYKACVNDSACRPGDRNAIGGRDDLPVRFVSWHEAVAYCEWLEMKLKSWSGTPMPLADALAGRRDTRPWHVTLPSEAEWERAARGVDGRIYPWGVGIDATKTNNAAAGRDVPTPVGAFPAGASPEKLLDMSGNVSEWTRSRYAPYPYRSGDGRDNLQAADGVARVVRGGSFQNSDVNVRATSRFRDTPTGRSDFIGFRVVVSPS